MNGFCSSPGHQDRPARLYACGWRCDQCKPGAPQDRRLMSAPVPRHERAGNNQQRGEDR